jgi:hypothetical protein
MNNFMQIREGGNAIPDSQPVLKQDVKMVIQSIKQLLPKPLAGAIQTDIGSAGYKIQSGDIDIFLDAARVVDFFETQNSKDPVKDAKQLLRRHFESQGAQSLLSGRNVHVGVPYVSSVNGTRGLAQVDVMVIADADVVAPWHQHGLRGQYDDPEFRGQELFILLNSLARFYNLKFDAFGAKLMNRDTNEVVGRTRREVAKILLGTKAKEKDLDSVKSIMAKLENDPDREGKLAQAKQDVAKGLLRLPETIQPGTAAWFRNLQDKIQ